MEFQQIRLQIERARRIPLDENLVKKDKLIVFEPGAILSGPCRKKAGGSSAGRVSREQMPVPVKARGDDVFFGAERSQDFLCAVLVTISQRAGAFVADEFSHRREVAGHGLAKRHQFVGDESRRDEQQGHRAGDHDDGRQLALDRNVL